MMRLLKNSKSSRSPQGSKAWRFIFAISAIFTLEGFGFNTFFWAPRTTNYASYRNLIMKDQPNMGYWRLGEPSGATAEDSSIAGNTGTYSGGCTYGQVGAIQNNTNFAVNFNGSNCVITTPKGYGPVSLSIEAWFKTTSSTFGSIATLANSTNGWMSPYLAVNSSGAVEMYACCSPSWATIATSASFNNGVWHHVVATVGASGMVIYVDGISLATSSSVTSHFTGTQYWTIGRDHANRYFNGLLDEVALYSYQLTAAQVQAHYVAGQQKGLTVNRHCLDVQRNGNATTNGVFTIYPGGGKSSQSVYCNMTDQGGGWTLIGRGREGWAWSDAGMNTGNVHLNVGTTSAFTPSYYSQQTVNEILGYKPPKDLKNGVFLKRAANTSGTAWQYYRWFFTDRSTWSWIFTNQFGLTKTYINGIQYSGGDTIDYSFTGNDASRIFTWAWGGHANVMGFSYGLNVSGGSTASTNYFWQAGSEAHSIPYTEVYVKPDEEIGNQVNRQWFSVPQSTTYAGAAAICANNGKKLCTRDQYCPNGSAGLDTPWGGSPASGDQWAAIADLTNDWVAVGSAWPSCQRHTEISGQIYGVPTWSTDASSYGFRNYVLCCD